MYYEVTYTAARNRKPEIRKTFASLEPAEYYFLDLLDNGYDNYDVEVVSENKVRLHNWDGEKVVATIELKMVAE